MSVTLPVMVEVGPLSAALCDRAWIDALKIRRMQAIAWRDEETRDAVLNELS